MIIVLNARCLVEIWVVGHVQQLDDKVSGQQLCNKGMLGGKSIHKNIVIIIFY